MPSIPNVIFISAYLFYISSVNEIDFINSEYVVYEMTTDLCMHFFSEIHLNSFGGSNSNLVLTRFPELC